MCDFSSSLSHGSNYSRGPRKTPSTRFVGHWHPRGSRAKTLWDCLWLKGDYLKIRSSNNMLHLIESDDADMIPRLRPKARPSRSKSRSRAGRVVDGSGAV